MEIRENPIKLIGRNYKESRGEPDGRSGGPGDPTTARGGPSQLSLFSVALLAFLLALFLPLDSFKRQPRTVQSTVTGNSESETSQGYAIYISTTWGSILNNKFSVRGTAIEG